MTVVTTMDELLRDRPTNRGRAAGSPVNPVLVK